MACALGDRLALDPSQVDLVAQCGGEDAHQLLRVVPRSTAAAKIATIGPEIIGGAGGCSAAAPKVMDRRGTTIPRNLSEASPAGHDECSDDRLTDEQERQGEPGAKTKRQRGGGQGQLRAASATLP